MPHDLLLVDEDAEPLAVGLRALGHVVRTVADGRAAVQAIDRGAFDAVILDRAAPLLDGIAVLHALRGADQTLPVVMLTAAGSAADAIAALRAGADDHLVKPVSADLLDARLHAILRGRRWARGSGDTIAAGDIVVSPATFRAWCGGAPLALGRLQFGLLAEFVRNAGAVLTRATLIARVWGSDTEPAGNIVDAQVCALRARLEAAGALGRIVTVRGVGYVLRG